MFSSSSRGGLRPKKTLSVFIAAAFLAGPCAAATFTVTTVADGVGTSGTLAWAIAQANAAGGSNSIVFSNSVAGTITLASALPTITSNVTIDASGAAGAVTVSGASQYQVFSVSGAGAAAAISNLTVSGGLAQGGAGASGLGAGGGGLGAGGGLLVGAGSSVSLLNVTFSGNAATGGAGGAATAGPGAGAGGGLNGGTGGGAADTGSGAGNGASTGGGGGGSLTSPGGTGAYGGGGGGDNAAGGAGGFGGGAGDGSGNGGGGAGLGGAVYVMPGGTLTIENGGIDGTNTTSGGGSGGGTAGAGTGVGAAVFLTAGTSAKFTVDASQTSTIASDIAGDGCVTGACDGGVIKNGAGTLVLSAVNSYSGGTVVNAGTLSVSADANLGATSGGLTFNGGTLQTTAGFSSARSIAIGSGGGTIDTDGQPDAFTGVVADAVAGTPGALNVASSVSGGVLTLSGVNTYSGGTTIGSLATVSVTSDQNLGAASGALIFNGGALATGAGITSGRAITLNAGGGVINTSGNNSSIFSGAIGGAGALEILGGGVVTLSGTGSAYQGGTTVNGATLVVAGDGSMGASSGALTFEAGSTLKTSGAVTSSRNISIAGGTTFDVDGRSDAFSGVISNIGGLTVASSVSGGVLTLSGADSYTGGTTVNSGATLALGANNALTATTQPLAVAAGGVFSLNGFNETLGAATNNGTINTGSGILTVSGYSGSGTLIVTPRSATPNLGVSGTATLTGTTLQVSGRPATGDYMVVNAGTLNATRFSAIELPGGYLDTPIYGANTLTLDLTAPASFTTPGQSGNQSAIGAVLSAANLTAAGDLAAVTARLGALSQSQLNAALDQLSPVSLAAMRGMSWAGAGASAAAVAQRMAGLQAGNADPDGGHVAFFNAAGSEPAYPGTLVAEGGSGAVFAGVGGKGCPWCFDDKSAPWGVFGTLQGSLGRLDSINGSSGYQPGYSFTTAGATMGADYRLDENAAAGVAGGYTGGVAQIAGGGGTVSSQGLRLGAYGTVYEDALHADLYMGGAEDYFDTSRTLSFLGRAATASPTGQEFDMDAQAGYDLKAGEGLLSPFFGLGYDRLTVGSFTESGAGSMDLSVAQQTAQSLRSRLGTKLSKKYKRGERSLAPFASIGWQHEWENQSRAIDAQFASVPGSGFAVNTADVARDGALLGAGLDADWGDGISARLAYAGEARADFEASTFTGSVRLRF